MAKINILFDNTNYLIDGSSLDSSTNTLKSHLSNVMSGSGAVINLGGTLYNVDSTKLTTATNDFVSHLGTISGSGSKVKVNGVEYSVDSTKLTSATADIHTVLGGMNIVETDYANLAPGLYETGSNYTVLLKDWDTLVSENLIDSTGWGVYDNREQLAGDLVLPENTINTNLTGYSGYNALTGVIIPGSVGTLNRKTFYNCEGLTHVIIGEGVTAIGDESFASCSNLSHVDVPNSLVSVGYMTFESCPLSYNEYGNGLYLGNNDNPYVVLHKAKDTYITSVEIHPDCKVIAGMAFELCTQLTDIVIPNGVVGIGYRTFYNCTSLTSIVIPDSVTTIEYNAFYCPKLTSITYTGTIEQWHAIQKNSQWGDIAATEIVCIDGKDCLTCVGGVATCQEKAICEQCGNPYGDYGSHNIVDGVCTVCGTNATVIESEHKPYPNNQNYVVLGAWDYSNAKSVNISVMYATQNRNYDWFSITDGTDYVAGTSYNETRNYLDSNGDIINTTGTQYAVKFGGSSLTTRTFENIDMLTGSVIFKTNTSNNNYYGVQVIVTPNY